MPHDPHDALYEALLPLAQGLVADWQDPEQRRDAADALAHTGAAEAVEKHDSHTEQQMGWMSELQDACWRELQVRLGMAEFDDNHQDSLEDARELCDTLEDRMFEAIRVIQDRGSPKK